MYQGEPMVKGMRVTGFTNGQEAAVVTGQNPASSATAAKSLIELLAARKAA
jgi:hypothetical protein